MAVYTEVTDEELTALIASYGLGATVNFLYPDLVARKGWGGFEYALVTGTLFLSQTAAFFLFGRFSGWRYKWRAFAENIGLRSLDRRAGVAHAAISGGVSAAKLSRAPAIK